MKNKFLKRITAVMITAAMILSVSSCGKNNDAAENPDSASAENETTISSDTSSSENTDTLPADSDKESAVTLTDQAGREIKLEKPAETIVSCYYITTYATIALGISDRVIGLEKKAETRPIYHMAAPDLLEKTQVGSLKKFNAEAVAALKPELVIMPAKLSDHIETLTDLGINVLVVNPESQELMEEMLILIAKACGVEENAQKLIDYYDEQLKNIAELIKGTDSKKVYMAGNSSYLSAAPNGMYQSDLIKLAGAENALNIDGSYWAEVSYETILASNPDFIIIPCGADYTKDDILKDVNLADVSAVKNNQIYEMPSSIEEWDSPIPSGILGLMWLTSVLHEDVYPFDQFKNDVSEYYSSFYNLNIDQNLISK